MLKKYVLKKHALLLILFFTGFSLFSRAAELPDSFSNEYTSTALGFKVTVTHSLTPLDDGTYQMRFFARSWFASIDETSRLRIDEETQQVIPLHYKYKRRVMGRDRDAELTFDWDKNTVTNNVQNTTWKMDIAQRVQDKLSYQLQLQQDLINNREELVYQIADGGRLKEYGFEIVGEELLETPLGKVNTVKVKRSRENDDRVTYAWLAKDWDYLLVRLQQEEDGHAYTIYLGEAEINGKKIKRFN